jgi:hypothetical protein
MSARPAHSYQTGLGRRLRLAQDAVKECCSYGEKSYGEKSFGEKK